MRCCGCLLLLLPPAGVPVSEWALRFAGWRCCSQGEALPLAEGEGMSPAEMEEKIKRQQADLDREREERNYFQLERDKINTFWEITKKVSPRARTLRVPLAHACRLLCLRGVASAAAVAALEPPSLLPQQAGRCSAAAAGWADRWHG